MASIKVGPPSMSRRTALAAMGATAMGAQFQNAAQGQSGGVSSTKGFGELSLWRTRLSSCWFNTESDRHFSFDADFGSIDVPIDHSHNTKGFYRLRLARFPAKRGASGIPVVYLFGGPTPSGDLWNCTDTGRGQKSYAQLVEMVTDNVDLVIIDHRGGFGCEFPRLTPVPLIEQMPLERCLGLDEREAHYRKYFDRLIEYWQGGGVDLGSISTANLAGDLDAIRAAFGYRKIRICGASNGTYRAREYLRKFPANVDSALLFVAHGYQKLPRVEHVRAALKRIEQAVTADPVANRYVPSLMSMFDELTGRLNRRPVRAGVKLPSGDADIELDGNDLALYFWTLFSSNDAVRKAPAEIWNMHHSSDYSGLATVAVRARTLGIEGADAYTAAYAGSSMPSDLEVSNNRRAAGNSLYLNRQAEGGESTCAWPLSHDDHFPFRHQVPVTYVQGEWDVRCPVEGPQAIGDASSLLIVPAMGHDNYIGSGDGIFWEEDILHAWLNGHKPEQPKAFPLGFSSPLFKS